MIALELKNRYQSQDPQDYAKGRGDSCWLEEGKMVKDLPYTLSV